MFTALTFPSPHVHLYFCPEPNNAAVPGSVAVLFVNCTTPPEVASSLTTRARLALDTVVCGVNTLIVVGALFTVTGLAPAVFDTPVRTI